MASDTPVTKVAQKARAKAILFLVLALAAGSGAVWLVKRYLDAMRQPVVAVATRQVVVAAVEIPIGTPLEPRHVKTVSWPETALPQGSFNTAEEVLGRTVRQAFVPGEAVITSRLADESAGRGLAALLSKGTRAMAVKVDQVIGVAGFVKPGDYVDVITTMTPDEETRRELGDNPAKIAKIILQNVRVLAVGEQLTSSGTQPVKVQVVTLELTAEHSERLALASRHGEVQLTIRSGIDQDRVATAGITPLALLAPDEGTRQPPRVEEPRRVMARRHPAKRVETATPAVVAPIVEILRGDRIEERKLRPSADSEGGAARNPR